MITEYLLFLGAGHLLGDFYIQNERIAKYKDEQYYGVIWHCLEYYIVVILTALPIFSLDMFLAATYTALAHWAIDTVKFCLLIKKKIRKNVNVFMVDQCAHIISISALAYIMNDWNFSIGHIGIADSFLHAFGLDAEILVRWVLAILVIHVPTNIFIQSFLDDYKPKRECDDPINKSDKNAGRRIGTIERLIMLLFLSADQYAAIGFVLTAKSIARYDKITKDEKFAEHYLLGTLVSTLCVIVCRQLVLI